MAYLKVTKNHNIEHYDVVYECGCMRDAVRGTMFPIACKEKHNYKNNCLKLPCGCWDSRNGPRWCDNHYDLNKEGKLCKEICDARNMFRHLEAKLQTLRDRRS